MGSNFSLNNELLFFSYIIGLCLPLLAFNKSSLFWIGTFFFCTATYVFGLGLVIPVQQGNWIWLKSFEQLSITLPALEIILSKFTWGMILGCVLSSLVGIVKIVVGWLVNISGLASGESKVRGLGSEYGVVIIFFTVFSLISLSSELVAFVVKGYSLAAEQVIVPQGLFNLVKEAGRMMLISSTLIVMPLIIILLLSGLVLSTLNRLVSPFFSQSYLRALVCPLVCVAFLSYINSYSDYLRDSSLRLLGSDGIASVVKVVANGK